MANFRYEVMLPTGKSHKGDVAARDMAEASRIVRAQTGGTIVNLKRSSDFLSMQIGTVKIKPKVLAMACSQFSILLRAGLPLARTIAMVRDQTADKTLKSVLDTVHEEVRVGASIADSFQKNIGALPIVFAETIRAGEDSGNLEHSFAKMEEYFTKSYKIKAKILKALAYPAILIVVAIVVVMIIVNVALPQFIPMFEGRDLPGPTKLLLDIYNASQTYWYVPIILIIVLSAIFRSYQKSPLGKLKLSGIAMKFPIFGKINTMLAASQYANTLATLLAAGLPVVKAMDITSRVISNYATGLSLQDGIKAITEGALIGQALSDNPYLPKLALEMTAVGEESGSLEAPLGKLKLSGIAMKFPIFGKINTMLAASQYANTLATLLAAGLPVVKAMDITSRVISNYATGLSLQDGIKAITEGALIGQALSDNPYLPKLALEMTAVGEESGSLEDTLSTIGRYYDEEADSVVESSIAMLEPMITIILGFVVAFILVALYMPMFDMYTGLNIS